MQGHIHIRSLNQKRRLGRESSLSIIQKVSVTPTSGKWNDEADDKRTAVLDRSWHRATQPIAEKESQMAKETSVRWLLIVTGSTLQAEDMDRPLAYYLKQRIEDCVSQASANRQSGLEDYLVRIVADFRWIHDEPLQSLPTISLGGPGVNALSHRWLEEVPVSLVFSERYFVQMDPDLTEPRASIWGMDNASTQIAVSVFVDRFLSRFLDRCAVVPAHLSTFDSDGESGTDTDDENNP